MYISSHHDGILITFLRGVLENEKGENRQGAKATNKKFFERFRKKHMYHHHHQIPPPSSLQRKGRNVTRIANDEKGEAKRNDTHSLAPRVRQSLAFVCGGSDQGRSFGLGSPYLLLGYNLEQQQGIHPLHEPSIFIITNPFLLSCVLLSVSVVSCGVEEVALGLRELPASSTAQCAEAAVTWHLSTGSTP